MPGTGASGGTAACFRVWEVGRLPYPFLTGLRPPEPGPHRRAPGGGGVRRKKRQVREKVEKSRNMVFFQWFVAPEGRKVGSLKRRVRSQLPR